MATRHLDSQPVDRTTGVHSDQTARPHSFYSQQGDPERCRRMHCFDAEKRKRLVFLTNNFIRPALTIAQLYKSRWQVELLFKWIKAFCGTPENAVKAHIWITISVYILDSRWY